MRFAAAILAVLVTSGPVVGQSGWTVVAAQWRPDENPWANRQVWQTSKWGEGWNDPQKFYPDLFRPAGSIHAILRNETGKLDSIILTHVDGALLDTVVTTPKRAGRVVWYKVEAPRMPVGPIVSDLAGFEKQENVPAGEWVECAIRLRERLKDTAWLQFRLGSGPTIAVPVSVEPPRLRVESISFSGKIDRLYVYVRALDGKPLKSAAVLLDGRDCSASAQWTLGPGGSALTLVEVKLDPAYDYGSFHVVELKPKDERSLAQMVRAWDSFFCIGLFGTVDEKRARAAKEHGINTYFATPSATLDKLGLNYIPSFAIGKGKKRTAGGTGLLFHYNHDEPDAHDWDAGKELPLGDRLGVNAMLQVLPLIRQQRKADSTVPNLVLIDNTYKPANWYVYGQIADVISTDPYVPFRGRQLDGVWQALDVARDGSAPRPLVPVLWACSLKTKSQSPGSTPPTPEEERMAVCYALACGAKGIGYFIDIAKDPQKPNFTGLSDIAPLWEEVGRINRDLAAVDQYIARSCPADEAAKQGDAWTRSLMCGANTMVLIAINTKHTIDFSAKDEPRRHEALKEVTLRFALPRHFTKCRITELQDGELAPFRAVFRKSAAYLTLDKLDTARVFVVAQEGK